MTFNHRFLPPIPVDMKLFYVREEVAGIGFQLANAVLFATGTEQQLELELDPTNQFDPNAIKVLGSYTTGIFHFKVPIGHVSAETARDIANQGRFTMLKPRLRNIWCGGHERPVVIVQYDIMGPKYTIVD